MSLSSGIDLCSIPAGQPPNGIPNFKDPVTLEPVYVSVTAILVTLAVTMVLGRLYINRNKLHIADCMQISSLVMGR
jgi:hypothetical protein